ncbi:MAG: cation:proton antiporter, partial [Clostridia bacterium]|nr:cation:proton antiporter [Clostridia bacterium]
MTLLFQIASALIAGMLMTRVVKPLKLPSVTAYLVAGILIGPYFLGRLNIEGLGFSSIEAVKSLALISEVALGFIAFDIGREFRISSLRKTG